MAGSAEALYRSSLAAFYSRLNDAPLSVETQPPASNSLKRELAETHDNTLAGAVRLYLPDFLPYASTGLDVAGSMGGLVYTGLVEVPNDVVPYFIRGVYASVMRIRHRGEVNTLLNGVDQNGYPTDPDKSRHFRGPSGRLCLGVLSGIATLQVLRANYGLVAPIADSEYRRSWAEPYAGFIDRAIARRSRSNDEL
jgi:hypothetical protein